MARMVPIPLSEVKPFPRPTQHEGGPNRLDRIGWAAAVLGSWMALLAAALHFASAPAAAPKPAQMRPVGHPRCFPEGTVPDGRFVQHFLCVDFRSADI